MPNLRRLLMGEPVDLLLVALMAVGCLLLWVGAPLGWLWIGSQLQSSMSLGTALMITMLGVFATIFAVVPMLGWLNRKHVERREARNVPIGKNSPLEVMLVITAAMAVVGFGTWFFLLSGASPAPLNVGY